MSVRTLLLLALAAGCDAPGAAPPGLPGAGVLDARFGPQGSVLGGARWIETAADPTSAFAFSVASAGDVNGDGYDDLVVGAPFDDSGGFAEQGRAYAYLGSAAGLGATPAWTADSLQAVALFGEAVASAGDVNGDGYSDVIVGAYNYSNGQNAEGRAFVFHGSAAGLGAAAAWTAESDQAGAHFGWAVASAGDVNGDGYSDVIVGAHYYSGGFNATGRACVYLGSALGLGATAAWTVDTDLKDGEVGSSVASAGDVNGDGFDDVIVGAPTTDVPYGSSGTALVYLGSAAGLASTPAWSATGSSPGAYFGESVAGAGDVNGDGYDDVIVGAWQAGDAFVYLGGPTGPAATPVWTGMGDQIYSRFGDSVAGVGDLNQDGYDDVVVGSPGWTNGQSSEGKAEIFLGSPMGPGATAAWADEGGVADASFGHAVAPAGDVNGDGLPDLAVGSGDHGAGTTYGEAHVWLGSCGVLDGDGDLVLDDCDTCPGADDALDADLDGVPDGCDLCPGEDDGVQADFDGIPDACDLCPAVDDPDQLDWNGDGVGDACDAPLALTVGPVQVAQPVTLSATDARPGEDVLFLVSSGKPGAGPCLAKLGGACLATRSPKLVGKIAADALGSATLVMAMPAGVAAGSQLTLQVAVARGAGGAESEVSAAVSAVVAP